MARQGYDLQFAWYDEGIAVYTTGMEHSPTSATGAGWEGTPWHATQRAAWEACLNALPQGLDLGCCSKRHPERRHYSVRKQPCLNAFTRRGQ
jgi:hypothetical protein